MSVRQSVFGVAARLLAVVALGTLGACASLTTTDRVGVSTSALWVVLEIENLSRTPLAGARAAMLVETGLRKRGVEKIAAWRPETGATLVALLTDDDGDERAMRRARAEGYRYALTGAVHEWNYKRVPDGEPVVGLTLSVSDVATGRVMWQGTAARSGWGTATLSGVADRVVHDLLAELRFVDTIDDGAVDRLASDR